MAAMAAAARGALAAGRPSSSPRAPRSRRAQLRAARRAAAGAAATDTAAAGAERVIADEAQYVMQTYGRPPMVFERGEGCNLYTTEGEEYLDMAAGIAVNILGHSDAAWAEVVARQAATLVHTSNLYHTQPMVDLAKLLCETSFADKVFYCNSGTEANEGALKFARKLARAKAAESGAAPATGMVAFTSGFHGRTMGALSLTSVEGYRAPFEPLVPGVSFATYGDLESARAVIKPGETCAVFVEPVQGEGGCYPATRDFLRGLREICDEAGAALVFDEVQCGMARTGHVWAHQAYGVEPDILTAAKPLAGGLPIGAVLCTEEVAQAMAPGDHGSTFAGGPLVCAAALEVVQRATQPAFLEAVLTKGERLRAGLAEALKECERVVDVRGSGLLVGVEFDCSVGPLVEALRAKENVLAVPAGRGFVLRFVPPLIISDEEIDKVCCASPPQPPRTFLPRPLVS